MMIKNTPTMKKISLILFSLFMFVFLGQAKDYRFVYVAHDHTTPTNHLTELLEETYSNACDYGDVVIFYLSNANTPIIVNVNTQNNDNKDQFEDLFIGELQNFTAHDVLARHDAREILKTISNNDFATSSKNLLYDHVSFDFYVGATFWQLGYNESLIAALYWALDIPSYDDDRVEFNVLHSSDDTQAEYSNKMPFGLKNVGGINKLLILPY